MTLIKLFALTTLFSSVLITIEAKALVGNNLAIPRMEARGKCLNGALDSSLEAEIGGVQNLMKKVNIFEADNRTASPPLNQDHAKAIVGKIETNGFVPYWKDKKKMVKLRSTAFMVSPCHILTNFHAVFGAAKKGDKTHTVTMTIQGSKEYKVIGTPVRWGSFASIDDWAFLKLDKCVGLDKNIGWGDPVAFLQPRDVIMTGYPADKDTIHQWSSTCKVYKVYKTGPFRNLFSHDCASRPGSSGSPIYTTQNSGVPQIVGMQSSEFEELDGIEKEFDELKANLAINYHTVFPQIIEEIWRAVDHFKLENPQVTMAHENKEDTVDPAEAE